MGLKNTSSFDIISRRIAEKRLFEASMLASRLVRELTGRQQEEIRQRLNEPIFQALQLHKQAKRHAENRDYALATMLIRELEEIVIDFPGLNEERHLFTGQDMLISRIKHQADQREHLLQQLSAERNSPSRKHFSFLRSSFFRFLHKTGKHASLLQRGVFLFLGLCLLLLSLSFGEKVFFSLSSINYTELFNNTVENLSSISFFTEKTAPQTPVPPVQPPEVSSLQHKDQLSATSQAANVTIEPLQIVD